MRSLSEPDEVKQLLQYGETIERRLSTGRGHDIGPDVLQQVLKLAIRLPGLTDNRSVRQTLSRIEAGARDALGTAPGDPGYVPRLRLLAERIRGLGMQEATESIDQAANAPEMDGSDLDGDPTTDPPDPDLELP